MKRLPARDPVMVAIVLFGLLLVTLLLYLAGAAVDRKTEARRAAPWSPPGWTSPTAPPPSTSR